MPQSVVFYNYQMWTLPESPSSLLSTRPHRPTSTNVWHRQTCCLLMTSGCLCVFRWACAFTFLVAINLIQRDQPLAWETDSQILNPVLYTSVEQSFLMTLIFHIYDTQRNAAKCFIWYKVFIRTTEPSYLLFILSIRKASKTYTHARVRAMLNLLAFHQTFVPYWFFFFFFKGNYYAYHAVITSPFLKAKYE